VQVVEGSLSGLEVAQSEGLRRLGGSISSSLIDAESALQSSVRVEVATAVEPLKQLPQLVAAAAARVAAATLQQQQQQQQTLLESGGDGLEGQPPAAAAVGGVLDQSLLLQEIREAVAAEVANATQQLISQQVSTGFWGLQKIRWGYHCSNTSSSSSSSSRRRCTGLIFAAGN
jgi:hypothetical protein